MSDALHILRSYALAVLRVTGARAVSIYLPGSTAENEVLAHEGSLPPVPELADTESAAVFVANAAAAGGPASAGSEPVRVASASPAGMLYRVPMTWVVGGESPGQERRRSARGEAEPEAAWVGLHFCEASEAARAGALQEPVWHAFLGLGATVAMHARSVLDPVTGLPEHREFQDELESALDVAKSSSRPIALLLLGPDEFRWVNDRLDRRSGDRILRQIATGLRAVVRRQDHVSRYGGAVFAVVLRDTTLEDARVVATNVVERLADQRYHRRLLRLDFSVGIAAWPADDPVDSQELVRRADQALTAARRGDAGNVRVWEKGSDLELSRSLDRLLKREEEYARALERRVRERTRELSERQLELERVNRELAQASVTDSLTGLANRRFLGDYLEREVALLRRRNRRIGGGPPSELFDLAFLMIDVDHFKSVNDSTGHAAGDAVLRQMRDLLVSASRSSDIVVRWGGDEFLLVARELASEGLCDLAERIRSAVEQRLFEVGEGRSLRSTCSIGFACFPFSRERFDALSWEQVLSVADRALYVSKASGRNAWTGFHVGAATLPDDGLFSTICHDVRQLVSAGALRVTSSLTGKRALVWENEVVDSVAEPRKSGAAPGA